MYIVELDLDLMNIVQVDLDLMIIVYVDLNLMCYLTRASYTYVHCLGQSEPREYYLDLPSPHVYCVGQSEHCVS